MNSDIKISKISNGYTVYSSARCAEYYVKTKAEVLEKVKEILGD